MGYIPQTPTGYVSHHSNAAQLEIMAQQRANLDAQQETQQRARALAAQSAMALLPRARLTEATRSPQACDRILWESNRRKARWGKGMVRCVTSTWSSRKTGYFSDVADSSVEFSAAQHVI